MNRIRGFFVQGLYLQSIQSATDELNKNVGGKPNPELLYWRGFARRRCGLFQEAQADLQALGNMTGWPRFASAAQLSTELGLLLEQRPPREHAIRSGDKVLFRVYYAQDDEFLQTVIAALPQGYVAASSFVGAQAEEIPIFVFNSAQYPQFVQFFGTLSSGPLQGWWRIGNQNGTITISQNNALEPPLPSNYPDMARLMSHELTHQLVRHIVGDLDDFPAWFNEGLARCGEGTYEPAFFAQNDIKMRQLLEQDAILPLEQLVSSKSFYHCVEQMKKGARQDDAYAQAFSMTRYLGTMLKGDTLHDFLDEIQQKRSFEAALIARTGMNSQEFYESWLDAINATHG